MPAGSMPATSDDRPAPARAAWALAVLAPTVGLALVPGAPALAAARDCPGALDAVLAGFARLWPHTSAGVLFWWPHVVMTVVAGAALWRTAADSGRARPVTAALMVVGFVLTPALVFSFAPTAAAAMAASALAMVAAPARSRAGPPVGTVRPALALLLLAVLVPVLAAPVALAVLMLVALDRPGDGRVPRPVAGSAAALVSLAAPAAVLFVMPALPPATSGETPGMAACLAPFGTIAATGAREALAFAYASTGPVVLALAVLGGFAARSRARDARTWALAALAAGAAAVAAAGAAPPAETTAPVVVAVWALAMAGVHELARPAIAGGRRPVAAGLVAIAVPALAWSNAATRPADADLAPLGHASVSRNTVARVLAALPDRSAIVREDAVVDVMLRSLDGWWQPSGKDIVLVPRSRDPIAAALASRHVHALPRAQRDLRHQGFEMGVPAAAAAPGVALVRAFTPCAPIGGKWRAAPALSGAEHLAVVADAAPARGPYVIYLGGEQPFAPAPGGWPARARRGFFAEAFDASTPDSNAALVASLARDGVGAPDLARDHAHLARLELWRTPDAPLALPVSLGSPAAAVSIRRAAGASGAPSVLCLSMPFEIRAF
jgi:hypothetical protein